MKSKADKKPLILEEVRIHGNLSRAARKAGISRRTVTLWASKDAVFKAALDKAVELGRE